MSSYNRMLMVSRAQVLSASRPDFRDIITRHASGLPGDRQNAVSVCGAFFNTEVLLKTELCQKQGGEEEESEQHKS